MAKQKDTPKAFDEMLQKLKAVGRIIDEKIKEEIKQYKKMGGVGEYVAHNITSLAVKTAQTLNFNNVADKIEDNRETVVETGKKIDKKVKEEVKQYKQMGGAGEYVAQNLTTVLREGATAIGQDEWAEEIEDNREKALEAGKKFDKKVDEEVKQYKQMGGAGEYIAQNLTTALREGATAIGQDEWAEEIENNREKALETGKKFDRKVDEEVKQYKQMDGAGEYIAQNLTTALREGATTIGQDEWAEKIENNREKALEAGKKFDRKVDEEVEQYKQMGGAGEYITQNAATLAKKLEEKINEAGDVIQEISAPKKTDSSKKNTFVAVRMKEQLNR